MNNEESRTFVIYSNIPVLILCSDGRMLLDPKGDVELIVRVLKSAGYTEKESSVKFTEHFLNKHQFKLGSTSEIELIMIEEIKSNLKKQKPHFPMKRRSRADWK